MRESSSPLSPQARANVLAEMGGTSQAGGRPAAPPRTQSPAAAGVPTKVSPQLLAAAELSIGTSLQGSAGLAIQRAAIGVAEMSGRTR